MKKMNGLKYHETNLCTRLLELAMYDSTITFYSEFHRGLVDTLGILGHDCDNIAASGLVGMDHFGRFF